MGDWQPEHQETLTESDGLTHILYLWNIDGQIRP